LQLLSSYYQLAFFKPGILPSEAKFRRQMRQILNFRYVPLTRPHNWQRRMVRVEYFNGLLLFAICAFVAIT